MQQCKQDPRSGRGCMRGLTLLEMMVALSIVGVLLGIGAPGFSSVIERNRTTTVANRLLTDLVRTRNEAVSFRGSAALCPSADARTCRSGFDFSDGWIAFRDRDADGMRDPEEDVFVVAQRSDLHERRVVTSAGRRSVRFRADGRNAGTNLSLRICDASGTAQRLLIVNVGGRARIAPATPGTSPCRT